MDADDIAKVYEHSVTIPVVLPAEIATWVTDNQDAIEINDRFSMEKKFGEMLIKAADSQQHRLLDTAHIMIETTRMLLAHKPITKGAEDTFIHHSLASLINNVFLVSKSIRTGPMRHCRGRLLL